MNYLKQPAQRAAFIFLVMGLGCLALCLLWFAWYLYRPNLRASGFIDQFGEMLYDTEQNLLRSLFCVGCIQTGIGVSLFLFWERLFKPVVDWVMEGK